MKEQIAIIGIGCIYPDAPNIYDYWNNIIKRHKPSHNTLKATLDSDESEFISDELESNEVYKVFSLIATRQALIDAHLYERDSIKDSYREKLGAIISESFYSNRQDSRNSSILNSIVDKFDIKGFTCELKSSNSNNIACVKIAIDELKYGTCNSMIVASINDEGIGVIVLKRLIDAKRDGDRIYSVIRSIGLLSEGTKSQTYQPCKEKKIKVINNAYDRADVTYGEIGLIETSGVGNETIDVSEFSALTDIYRKKLYRNTVIGSIKNEYDMLDKGASMASLIKVSLALYQKVLPPSRYEENIEHILADTTMSTTDEAKPWIINKKNISRYAVVSAFDEGSINYHIVLEEEQTESDKPYRMNNDAKGVMISAITKEELIEKINELSNELRSNPNVWRQKKYNYYVNRNCIHRLAFVACDAEEVSRKCYYATRLLKELGEQNWIIDDIIYSRKEIENGKVCIVYGGQNIEDIGMLSHLAKNSSIFRNIISIADDVMLENGMEPISKLIYPLNLTDKERNIAKEKLKDMSHIQSILSTMQAGVYEVIKDRGVRCDYSVGHSFSELTALWTDEVFDTHTLIDLANMRGYFASNVIGNTAMLKVNIDMEVLKGYIYKYDNLYISNENSYNQAVVAGNANEIEILKEELTIAGINNERINMPGAYHTPYMVQAAEAFGAYLNKKRVGMPGHKVISSYSGDFYGSDVVNTLVEQIINPVLFKDCIEKAYDEGARTFIQIGTKKSMDNLIEDILADKEKDIINIYIDCEDNSQKNIELQLAKLAVLGYNIKADKTSSLDNSKEIVKNIELNNSTVLNGEKLSEIAMPKQVVIKNNLRNIDTLHTEVFSKFMEAQNYQINAISKILEVNKDKSEIEKKQVLDCIGKFRDNSLNAFKIYFGDKTNMEDKQNIVWSEDASEMSSKGIEERILLDDKDVDLYSS